MKIHLVSFVTDKKFGIENYYTESIDRLVNSAKKFGIENFHIYTPATLPVSKHVLNYMQTSDDPGFGFYSWKPVIILDVLNKIEDGDVVLYHDAGRIEYKYEFKNDINILVKEVIEKYNGIGVGLGPFKQKDWCKKDCFVYMNCNEEKYWNLNQLSANWSIWEKNSLSKEILELWQMYCFHPHGIVTTYDTESNLSDFDTFREHRWDQAILTNLIYKYHFDKKNVSVLQQSLGWEKDINNFINSVQSAVPPRVSTADYSLLKTPNIVNTDNGLTIVIDVLYKNNYLQVITTGAIKSVKLITPENELVPDEQILDPHDNINSYTFNNVEYSAQVELKFEYHDEGLYKDVITFNVEKDYYEDYIDETILTTLSNTSYNPVHYIKTHCKYHINLGYDRVIVHEIGPRIYELYDELRDYIESGKVILMKWSIPNFYQFLKSTNKIPTNVGDTSQMNHTLYVFKNIKYLTAMNTDYYLVTKKRINNMTSHLDELREQYDAHAAGGFIVRTLDFKKPSEDIEFYKSTEVITSNYKQHNLDYITMVFVKNVSTITCHFITSGNRPVNVNVEDLAVHHYHFIYSDTRRYLDEPVIDINSNINLELFE